MLIKEKLFSVEEYLKFEKESEDRYEFVFGKLVKSLQKS